MDRYGAIELERSANRSVSQGFVASITIMTVLLFMYFSLSEESQEKILRPIIKTLTEIAPPPSLQPEVLPSVPVGVPIEPIRATFGIPVPVPDLEAPEVLMPNLNEHIQRPITTPTYGIPGNGTVRTEPRPIIRPEPVTNIEDDPDIFISVDEEPKEVVTVASLLIYPEMAKRAGLEGKVIISALIDIDGRVIKTRVERADYEIFRLAAIEAVMKARFTPARAGTEPVKVWTTIPISFKLTEQ
jgi:protein TonB